MCCVVYGAHGERADMLFANVTEEYAAPKKLYTTPPPFRWGFCQCATGTCIRTFIFAIVGVSVSFHSCLRGTGWRREREGNRREGLRTGGSVLHGRRLQAYRRGWQGQLRPAVEHDALEVESKQYQRYQRC